MKSFRPSPKKSILVSLFLNIVDNTVKVRQRGFSKMTRLFYYSSADHRSSSLLKRRVEKRTCFSAPYSSPVIISGTRIFKFFILAGLQAGACTNQRRCSGDSAPCTRRSARRSERTAKSTIFSCHFSSRKFKFSYRDDLSSPVRTVVGLAVEERDVSDEVEELRVRALW